MKEECKHKFVATTRRGEWEVQVKSTNNRGKPRDETVYTTVFECGDCGAEKEFPDTWEKNYIAPKNVKNSVAKKKKTTIKKAVRPKKKKSNKSA